MIYGVGDVHGHFDALVRLLHEADLIDRRLHWTGGDHTLVFMGDFVDRGDEAPAVVALVMRLQQEAAAAGGRVLSVLGNHDLVLVLAARYPNKRAYGIGTFREAWLQYGGVPSDIAALSPTQINWLAGLPMMLRVGDLLVVHADALLYRDYGRTVNAVNLAIDYLLAMDETDKLAELNERFGDHQAFWQNPKSVAELLHLYGGRQIWHGHTPIHKMTGGKASQVDQALVYAGGLCVNLDGGLYLGGRGFVYSAPS
jgi:hypothetical protein